jgi:hypothetical protein
MRGLLGLLCAVGLVLPLAGCMGGSGPADEKNADDASEPVVEIKRIDLFNASRPWPRLPSDPGSHSFEVPANATRIFVEVNWRGNRPAGYYAAPSLELLSPSGSKHVLYANSLASPYLCANPSCGPVEPRKSNHEGQAGAWAFRLQGSWTADADLLAYYVVKVNQEGSA